MNLCRKLKVESRRWRRALTLLEMMVAVTLLAVIMIGLLAMFQYTQRALRVANMQTDVFENARAAIQLVARDLSELSDYGDSNILNAAVTLYGSPVYELQPPAAPGPTRVYFDEAFWLTRVNDVWQGIGYYVDGTNFGVGTLYRFSETTNTASARFLLNRFSSSTNTHRVSDGIVHFYMEAVYATNDPGSALPKQQYLRRNDFRFPLDQSNALPAFIDLEIGVLEPATLKQFNALTNNPDPTIPLQFLQRHVGKIHFFRERVPIRNYINPYRADEVL